MKALIALLFGALWLSHAAAAGDVSADLPPAAEVERVLAALPELQAASSQVSAEQANRERLAAGTHEWNVRLSTQRRRVTSPSAPDEQFAEQGLSLERPLRLPGKAALDEALGARGVDAARWAEGDARHEAARALLKAWFSWLRERAGAELWNAQAAVLRQNAANLLRRNQLGDASRLDAVSAEAALAQAEAQSSYAQAREQAAALQLRRRYPGLNLPPRPELSEPQPLSGSEAEWTAAILEHSHELGLARSDVERARTVAERAERERLPDPTVGLHLLRERGGDEQIVGISVSIPLPGQARRAAATAGQAQAAAAASREAAALQKISAEAAALYHGAAAARTGWQNQRVAALRLAQAADMSARAYQLGEGNLGEVLMARRYAHEARLAALQAQVDALELQYRLLLDAHRMWDFDRHSP
ncbi:MAG: TolC family protein [Rhodocyclaceae bacterium]|nr:TolC family protein [Rhodocyclaceae bacterium]